MAEISFNGSTSDMVGSATKTNCRRWFYYSHDHEKRLCGNAKVCEADRIQLFKAYFYARTSAGPSVLNEFVIMML